MQIWAITSGFVLDARSPGIASMNHFFVPQFIPRTLDELPPEPDEVTSLVYLEDSIAKEVGTEPILD